MSIYSDKLTHVQVVINCLYSIAQFCAGKDTLAHISGTPSHDDVMSYDSLTTCGLVYSVMTLKFFHQPLKPLLFDIKHCYRDGQQKCIKIMFIRQVLKSYVFCR